MPTLHFLPSIRESETITCWRCNTRQFPKDNCSVCRSALNVNYLVLPVDTLLNSQTEGLKTRLARCIGAVLRILRKRRRICQSQLALMPPGIDRSYLSKAESGFALLPLSKLLPLVRSLGLTAVILRFEDPGPRAGAKPNSQG